MFGFVGLTNVTIDQFEPCQPQRCQNQSGFKEMKVEYRSRLKKVLCVDHFRPDMKGYQEMSAGPENSGHFYKGWCKLFRH